MRTLITTLLVIVLTGSAALAEDEAQPPEFDVEIIVVRNVTPDDTELRMPAVIPVDEDESAVAQPRRELRRFPPLGASDLKLGEIMERLLRSEQWSPVLHHAWRQPAASHAEAAAMAVAGRRLGASATGTVRLSLDRFLRLELDLELDPGTGELFRLQQARRLRSGQTHYFDHPQFGVIALVDRAPQTPAPPAAATQD